jgi:hypothetical protein
MLTPSLDLGMNIDLVDRESVVKTLTSSKLKYLYGQDSTNGLNLIDNFLLSDADTLLSYA